MIFFGIVEILNFSDCIVNYFRYKLLKSKALENEDDSTSSDSYTEKVPSIIIIEKFNSITLV